MEMTVFEKIVYAKARMLVRHKFFGALLLDFPLVENKNTPTMATNNKVIFYNPSFVNKVTKNQCMTLVLHELKHIIYKHFYRFPLKNMKNQDDIKMVNYALDYAINSIIINEMAAYDTLIDFPKGILYDEMFKGWNAEKILEYLKKEKKKDKSKWEDRVQQAQNGIGQFDDHMTSSQTTGDESANDKKKGKSQQDQLNDIDKKIFNATGTLSPKERGTLPADIQRMLDEYFEELEGHVDWKRYLKKKIQDFGRGQYTTSRVNRAYLPYNIYLPGQIGARAKVALALDTSGSISNEDVVEFINELRCMLRIMPQLEVILYGCDAAIHGKERIKGMRNFRTSVNKVLTGGGGTSFIPVFKDLLANKDKDIKALFYFTDGYGDQNSIEAEVGPVKWETFWVLQKQNRNIEFPFGKKVIMWENEKNEDE